MELSNLEIITIFQCLKDTAVDCRSKARAPHEVMAVDFVEKMASKFSALVPSRVHQYLRDGEKYKTAGLGHDEFQKDFMKETAHFVHWVHENRTEGKEL